MPTHKMTRTWQRGAEKITATEEITVEGEHAVDASLAASTNDIAFALAVDVSQMKTLYLYSTTDTTVETNSSSSPANSISLQGGVPYLWTSTSGIANPLTTDVTSLFLSNGEASIASFSLRIGYDASL
jgi:hypothetical protein